MRTLANSEDPDKISHNGSTPFTKTKKILRETHTLLSAKYNLQSLHSSFSKTEKRINLCIKG